MNVPPLALQPFDGSSAADSMLGTVLADRYLLRREAGRGGTCVIYESEHLVTGRPVAVKLLRGEYAQRGEMIERLLREARVLGLVRHPNIVDILDAGVTTEGHAFVVMEMIDGRTVEGLLASRGRFSVGDAAQIVRTTAEALSVAHDRGVVHRDIKPSNLFVARAIWGGETLKLIDFGIASLKTAGSAKLTVADTILGTPEYMAPEQLMASDAIDARADVYALGVTLYELLVGVVPFPGTYQEVLLKTATSEAPPIRNSVPDAPPLLGEILAKALARDPKQRFGNARELARALAAIEAPRSASLLRAQPPPLPPAAKARTSAAADTTPAPAGPPADVVSRRRFRRAPYVSPVRVQNETGGVDGRSEDISEGGMLVVCEGLLPQGQTARVRFGLPTTGRIVTCEAMIRWVKSDKANLRGRTAFGLEFTAIDEATRREIRRYTELMGDDPRG